MSPQSWRLDFGITLPWRDYLRQRIQALPELTAKRLMREIRDLGYSGG